MTLDLADDRTPDLMASAFTWKTLHAISNTEFVPRTLRGNPEAILAAVLYGRELGMGPMESLRVIDMIDGKPTPSAEWMVSKVFDGGHVIFAEEQTDTVCTVTGIRYRDGEELARMSFTFSMDMAKRAGLATKNNWKHYPEAMLYWRATAQLCRQFFPDVLRGLSHLPEELGDADWEPPQLQHVVPRVDVETGEIVDEPVLGGQETLPVYADTDPERPFE